MTCGAFLCPQKIQGWVLAGGGQLIETMQHLGGLEHTAPLAFVHQAYDACGE